MSEPKRVIGGHQTKVEFNCGLYIDPKNGDIYSVNNDTLDTMTVFSREARGDVPPTREMETPHGTYGIAVYEEDSELFLTVQHASSVVVYPKYGEGTVYKREGDGDDAKITVQFPGIGLKKLVESGAIRRDEETVAFITGGGLKTIEAVEGRLAEPVRVPANAEAFDAALAARQSRLVGVGGA